MVARNRGITRASEPETLQKKTQQSPPPYRALVNSQLVIAPVSLVGLHSVNAVCEYAILLHQEQKRDHFGTVAIDVHHMFHHDSTR